MAQSYFIWNGVDSRSMGIISRAEAPLIRPEERVEHVVIPGLPGDLTETQGENVYNSYIQTVEISVRGADRVRQVFCWLRGSGYVSFSAQPHLRQPARVIGAVTLNKISRNLDHWAGQAQFYCQPLKERLYEVPSEITLPGTIINSGDVDSRPLIIATPSANADEMTIVVNGQTLALANVDGVRRIDCLAQEISNANQTALYTVNSAGPFPVLRPGGNTIGGEGWSSLVIYKRERFL